MNMVTLARRIPKMTKRDKLDAFLHYAFDVSAGREPAHCGPAAARDMILAAIERCRALRFDDLVRQYTVRMQMEGSSTRTPPIERVYAPFIPDDVVRTGRWWSDGVQPPIEAVVEINRSSWHSGTTHTFSQLLDPNMRHGIFQPEESRRHLIYAMQNFFVSVAVGTIHTSECRITRTEAVDLLRRLRDMAQFYGESDLVLEIARDVDRCREAVLTWETNQRLEGERLMQEAAHLTRQRQGIRRIWFPKKKKDETLESLMEDDKPRQPTLDEILGLDEPDEW